MRTSTGCVMKMKICSSLLTPKQNNFSYGNPLWKTSEPLRSRPFLRDFHVRQRFQDGSKSRMFENSAFSRSDRKTGNLKLRSKLTGLRDIFFFLFPGDECCRPGPATLRVGAATGTYSTCPSSTTVNMRTPYCEKHSPDDGLTAPSAHQCSLVSFKCLLEARLQICNDLARRFNLHLRPRSIDEAASDAIRNGSSLR